MFRLLHAILPALLLCAAPLCAAPSHEPVSPGTQEIAAFLRHAISAAPCARNCVDELSYLSADEIAALSAARLEKAISDPEILPSGISYRRDGDLLIFSAGPVILARIHYTRLSPDRAASAVRAAEIVSSLRELFSHAKTRNFSIAMLMKFLLAFIYPLLLIGVLMGLRALYRRAKLFMHELEETHPHGVRLARFEIVSMSGLRMVVNLVLGVAVLLAGLASIYLFLLATFYYFPVTRSYALAMFSVLSSVGSAAGAYALTAGWRIAAAIVVAIVVYSINGWLDKLFDNLAEAGPNPLPFLHAERLDIFEYLAKGLVLVAGLVTVLMLLPERGGLLGSVPLVLIGLAFTLAASGLFKNVVAGFLLAFSKSHTRGTEITLSGHSAVLLRIGVFFSNMRFADGSVRLVPNICVIAGQVRLGREADLSVWEGEISLGRSEAHLAELYSLLEQWADGFGSGGSVRISALRGNRACFQLSIPFIQSSDIVFLPAACDSLSALLLERKMRLARFELRK